MHLSMGTPISNANDVTQQAEVLAAPGKSSVHSTSISNTKTVHQPRIPFMENKPKPSSKFKRCFRVTCGE